MACFARTLTELLNLVMPILALCYRLKEFGTD